MKNLYLILFTFITIFGAAQVDLNNGLMAYYPFKTNALDVSGNNNNANVVGATLTQDRNQLANNAYNFSTISNRLRVSYNSSLDISGTKQFSAAVWIYPTSSNTVNGRIINFGSIYGKAYEVLYTGNLATADSGRIEFYNYSSATIVSIYSSVKIALNKWYLIIVTVDANLGDSRLYINNSLVGISSVQQVIPTSSSFTSQAMLTIGNHDTNNWGFLGIIDEVRLYKRILNASEIDYLYNHYSAILNRSTAVDVKVFPNPFTNKIEIQSGDEKESTFELIDLYGNILLKDSFIKSTEIELSSIASGNYLIRLTTQNGTVVKKVQKI